MGKMFDGILGFVVGDALGVPYEFKERNTFKADGMSGYGTYNQPPGTWSDDSSMVLATMKSLMDVGNIDLKDIMKKFMDWFYYAKFTPYGDMFDVGSGTARAIVKYNNDGIHYGDVKTCGGRTMMDNGNGALMRILPVAMVTNNPDEIMAVAHLTHNHPISDFACLFYSSIVQELLKGKNKRDAYKSALRKWKKDIKGIEMFERFMPLLTLDRLKRDEIKSTGYVVDTLIACLWCFLTTDEYYQAILTAVNLGSDTDTIAALTGGLAGMYYGKAGIPKEWIDELAKNAEIKRVARKFEKQFAV